MDELVGIMRELLAEIKVMNYKLDAIRGNSLYSMEDMYDKLEDIKSEVELIKGDGLYNSVSDICDKIDDVKSEVELIKGDGLYNTISDVCNKLDSLEMTITLGDNY